MSSQKGSGYPFRNGAATSSPKGKGISGTDAAIDQLSSNVSDISLDPYQGGGWEVFGKKSKNKGGSSATKQSSPQNPSHRAWAHPDVVQKLGMRSNNASQPAGSRPTLAADSWRNAGRCNPTSQASKQLVGGNQIAQVPVAPTSLKHGWNWSAIASSTESSENVAERTQNREPTVFENSKSDGLDNEDDEDVDGSDVDDDFDDEVLSDEFDSDSSSKSHDTRKKNRWFKELFESMDKLAVEQISDPERRWHCPACKGGPGAIDWYRGLQPLITHAKTKGSSRVKLHRELAQLLDEELKIRGTSAIPAGEVFGKWKGLDQVTEKEIVWPPMVIIMNTRLDKDDNDKWIGMGNQELLDFFSSYAASRARHSYGPQGHRGMSLLIFESSAVGYLEAERLSKHFTHKGRDRDAWDHRRVPFYPGGDRTLYGYMAEKEDIEFFNKHCQGKSKLKYEIKSYIDMVVKQLKQMSEENQQLLWFKNKVAKEQRHSKALEESYGFLSEKLRKTEEDNRIVRLKTKMHHEDKKEEMDSQEQFFQDQIQAMYDARVAREVDFEKVQQEKRDEVVTLSPSISSVDNPGHRAEEIKKFIKLQDKDMDEFVAERDRLVKVHEERVSAFKRRQWEDMVALEKELDAELSDLMQAYLPENRAGDQDHE